MRCSWTSLRRFFASARRGRTHARRPVRTRLQLERLEDRVVPTVVFEPHFGNESMTQGNGPVLNDAPVYLLFWGSYWNSSAGSASEADLVSAITNEYNSPVFSHLSQYTDSSGQGAGPAYVKASWTATEDADPVSGFSDSQLQSVVTDAINDPNSPVLSPGDIESIDGGHAPLYLVITPPGIDSYKGSNIYGYHSNYTANTYYANNEAIVYGWAGNSYDPSYDTQDSVTLIASHETGEALTDPYIRTNYAWAANAGASWPYGGSPDEIGDFEPEFEPSNDLSYSYRLNGSLVQALWDENALAFTVPDGNTQNFYVDPQYDANNNYIGNELDIYGDQFGPGSNNNITIDATVNGGLNVVLNGESVTFDPGQITSLYVYTGSGTDDVSILSTPSGMSTYIDGEGSDDTVTIGNYAGSEGNGSGYLGNINGSIDVYGGGNVALNIDDSGDSVGQTVYMYDGEIDYGGSAPIYYTPTSFTGGVTGLAVYGGSGGNTFNVENTSNFADATYLNTGVGNDTVNAYATTGGLDDYNPGGQDNTYVGLGNTSNINGTVDVYGNGITFLTLDDSLDSTTRTVYMYDGLVIGLAPADIEWTATTSATSGGVNGVSVYGGSGGDTFNVVNTSYLYYADTFLGTGSGNDTVNVYATQSGLEDHNGGGNDTVNIGLGNVGSINGYIDPYGSGTIAEVVDDHLDGTARTATLSTDTFGEGTLNGLGNAGTIYYSTAVTSLTIDGGSGNNVYNIQSVVAGTAATLNTGAGSDAVNVGSAANTLDPIQGALAVNGQGNTTLTFNDLGGNSGGAGSEDYTYELTQNTFRRYDQASQGTATVTYSGMATVTVQAANAGSNGRNLLGVEGTAAGTTYQVDAGAGYNQFVVEASNNILNNIQGSLFLHGAGSGPNNDDLVEMEDVDNTTRHTFVLTAGATSQSGLVQRFNSVTHAADMAPISYDGLNAYAVLYTAGDLGDTIDVQSVAANAFTIVAVGSPDKVTIGNPSHTMAGILGDVQVQAVQGQKPTVTLDDSQDANSETLTMSSTPSAYQITGLLHPTSVGYGNIWLLDTTMQVTLKTGAGSTSTNDVFQVNDLLAAPVMKIDAGNGSNTLVGPNQATTWTISGANSGKLGSISFSNVQNLVGGTGVDTFKFSGTGAKVSSINGGGAPAGQGDWLNYAAFGSASTVNVNLAAGSATNVNGGAAGSVTGIQNVVGSASGTNNLTGDAQGNILIGGSGLNTIVGGSGNSLLIGGSGHGTLTGGSGQDILIAGTTTFNDATTAGQDALMAILDEMQSSDTFAQKVSDLIHGNASGGGSDLNGGAKLTWGVTGATVKASSGSFTLAGDTSSATTADWFFANSSSTISDFDDDGVNDEHNNNAIGVI